MAEYMEREKYMKDKYNCDLIQIDNLELVPLYQIIDRLEQSIEREKIDKAIEEIKAIRNNYEKVNNPWGDRWEYTNPYDKVLQILKRNIGE